MLKEIEKTIGFFVTFFIVGGISIGITRALWPPSGYVDAVNSLKNKFKLLVAIPC